MGGRKVDGVRTREERLAYARRWREENCAYFDAIYLPAEALQIEPDEESAAKLDAISRRDAWLASIVAACLLLATLLVAGAVGWALRGWIG